MGEGIGGPSSTFLHPLRGTDTDRHSATTSQFEREGEQSHPAFVCLSDWECQIMQGGEELPPLGGKRTKRRRRRRSSSTLSD